MQDSTPLKEAGKDVNDNELRELCKRMVLVRKEALAGWDEIDGRNPAYTFQKVADNAQELENLINQIGDMVGV